MTKPTFELDEISSLLRTEALQARDFNCALLLASLYGLLHWENISGFFADEELEQALFERWKDEFKVANGPQKREGAWCHIVSRTYAFGGHTRLLRQLAKGLDHCRFDQSLIVSQVESQKIASEMRADFQGPLQDMRILEGNLAQRARHCFADGLHAQVVVMHIHPHDIVAALAARALRHAGKTVLFVNHADHVFSYGPGAADAVLEICATGWKTTKERRHARAQYFMGIPMTSEHKQMPLEKENRKGPILTIGSPDKYRPSHALDFSRFLERLLVSVPNEVVVIGPNGAEPWWGELRDKFPDRIHFKGFLPHDKVEQEYKNASCYVDSFPMDGGTTFSEAMLQGVPTFGLNRQSSLGISPADDVRCNTEEDLLDEVTAFLRGGMYPERVKQARRTIAIELSTEATVRRAIDAARGQGAELPASLSCLGNRSIDYNAELWRAAGQLRIPRKLWVKLRLLTRLRLFLKVGDRRLSKTTLKTMRKRILLG